jgi:hypothetical protein
VAFIVNGEFNFAAHETMQNSRPSEIEPSLQGCFSLTQRPIDGHIARTPQHIFEHGFGSSVINN